ncbi:MAG: hybrid sensor histidine kinase/response regulator [Desulfovibrionaceae bacterium]
MTWKPETAKPPCVLVVDDEPANISILAGLLKDGHRVLAAKSGEEALRRAAGDPRPDLILLDVMMPGMDGFEVLRRLKCDPGLHDVPVIFITALSHEQDEAKGLEAGAVDYIPKPFNPAVVAARIRNHLQLQQARRELARQNEILRENVALREEVERITRHDLKTPLGMVIHGPDLLLQEGGFSEDQKEILTMIQDSGRRMLDMINSSLDLHKMETGRYRLNPGRVDLAGLVRGVERDLDSLVSGKKLAFRLEIEGKPASGDEAFEVLADELLCYSMLANLIANAAEASPDGGAIRIAMDADKDDAVVSITNKGAVPLAIRFRFFEKYATHGKPGGAGLGAYSAKLMAETQNGRIALSVSDAENATTLAVTLPRWKDA